VKYRQTIYYLKELVVESLVGFSVKKLFQNVIRKPEPTFRLFALKDV
jgi:hypothetical protein